MKINSKNKYMGHFAPYIFILILLSSLLFISVKSSKDYIVLKNKSGNYLEIIEIKNDVFFRINFRHSVNKGLVIEEFDIDLNDNKIRLKKGSFESYGAGMLDSIENKMEFIDDKDMNVISFDYVWQDSVSYTSGGIAKHKLIYEDNIVDFFELNPYKSIKISVEKLSVLKRILLLWR